LRSCIVTHGLLAVEPSDHYDAVMIIVRFPDAQAKRWALGYLAGRFSFKSWATGEVMVPEVALPFLATEGIPFFVEGPATYERIVPALRSPSAPAV
jgi:hypothetical protein